MRSARWLYVFVLIPFYCFQQRKMWPFPCQQKLTHTGADCGADPHPDPHGETKDRSTWSKEFPTSSFLQQKCPQSLIYQRLEGFLSLGKDEVGGSNPPSSSTQLPPKSKCLGGFCYIFATFCSILQNRRKADFLEKPTQNRHRHTKLSRTEVIPVRLF